MGEAAKFSIFATLESMGPCWKCGISFAAPANYVKSRREDKGEFFCPNGHRAVYGKSVADELRAELEEEKRKREWAERGRDTARRAEAIAGGKLKALKERVKNGVCPCCKRSFENLARHMKTKHPEFPKTEDKEP